MRLTVQSCLLLFFKGVAMGVADLIPGISGGTIALITGIYQELLTSLKACGPQAVKKLFTEGIASCWQHINGQFLFPLVLGILCSIFSFASLIHYLLSNFAVPVWSFFFGLIIISFLALVYKTKNKDVFYFILLVAGTIVAWYVTKITPIIINDPKLPVFFGAGMLAICAMILPGLSGSFILLLLGLYDCVLQAVITVNLPVIFTFAFGCCCGLLCFCRFLDWLLLRFHTYATGFLSGLVLGALNKAWPWKQSIISSEGSVSWININPWVYASNESVADLAIAVTCILAGLSMVILLEYKAKPLTLAEK